MKDYKLKKDSGDKAKPTPFGEKVLSAMLSMRADEWEYSDRNKDRDGWSVSYSAEKIVEDYLFRFSITASIRKSEIYRQLELCKTEEDLRDLCLEDCQEFDYLYISVERKDNDHDILAEDNLYSVEDLLRDCQLPGGWERWVQEAFDEQLLGTNCQWAGFWADCKETRLKEIWNEESYE